MRHSDFQEEKCEEYDKKNKHTINDSHSESNRPGRGEIKGFEDVVCVARHIWTELFLTHKDKLIQLTAIGEKLLKDLLECVFVYFSFGTLLFILQLIFLFNICFRYFPV